MKAQELSKEMEALRKNIRDLRKLKGWSQTELAKKLSLKGKSGVCMIESGGAKLSVDQLILVGKIFNIIPPFDLLRYPLYCDCKGKIRTMPYYNTCLSCNKALSPYTEPLAPENGIEGERG